MKERLILPISETVLEDIGSNGSQKEFLKSGFEAALLRVTFLLLSRSFLDAGGL